MNGFRFVENEYSRSSEKSGVYYGELHILQGEASKISRLSKKWMTNESSHPLIEVFATRHAVLVSKRFLFLAWHRRGMKASVATAARSISAACDKGEVYLPQRSVL